MMTDDLLYLTFTALLTGSLWIPYVSCQVRNNGLLTPKDYRDPEPRPIPLWGKRAYRAHINAVESFAPFAGLVLVAHLAGKADGFTAFWAGWFFWLRLVHAIVYVAAIPYVRTLVFTLSWIALPMIAAHILA
jgi:uncharacterized MAPEG superfamily protein